MNHSEARQKLLEWRDERPAETERRQVGDHLRQCADCRRFGERLEWITQVFSEQPAVEPSEFFVEQVMGQLHPPAAERSRRAAWWIPVPVLASVLMLLLFLLGQNRPVSTEALLGGDLLQRLEESS